MLVASPSLRHVPQMALRPRRQHLIIRHQRHHGLSRRLCLVRVTVSLSVNSFDGLVGCLHVCWFVCLCVCLIVRLRVWVVNRVLNICVVCVSTRHFVMCFVACYGCFCRVCVATYPYVHQACSPLPLAAPCNRCCGGGQSGSGGTYVSAGRSAGSR